MTQLCYSYICIDCDEIMDVRDILDGKCPRCNSRELYPLSKWVPSTRKPNGVPMKETPEVAAL